jgi:hypothetical protein
MKITIIAVIVAIPLLMAGIMGCTHDTVGSIEPFYISDPEVSPKVDAVLYYPNNIKVSATDAPLEYEDLEKVNIKFSKMEVSMDDIDDEYTEWITINEDGGQFNLLELTNGTCQTLALAKLDFGQYQKTRFQVSEVTVMENEQEHPVYLDSETITITREFFVEEGRMTNFVLDFDAKRSLQKMDSLWVMTPIIRFADRYKTGAIMGNIVYPEDLKLTDETSEKSIEETTEESTQETTEESTGETTEESTEETTEESTQETTEESTEKPVKKSTEEAVKEVKVKATVNAYRDGETEIYSSTISHDSGKFILGYLETGLYDVEIKAGPEDEYFLWVEDVDVVMGEVINLGKLELALFEEKKPIINTITVDISNIQDISTYGTPFYVTIFPIGEKITDDNVFETQKGEILGTTASITLDNSDEGYPDGVYGIRVHIDFNRDGKLTAENGQDFVAVGEATVSGGSAYTVINGPWGAFLQLAVANQEDVSPVTTGRMYLTLVSQGGTWSSYSFGEANFDPPLGIRGIACWPPPNGTYDFLVFIDTNSNMEKTGEPDLGDWVASRSITISDGVVTDPSGGIWVMTKAIPEDPLSIDSWSQLQ